MWGIPSKAIAGQDLIAMFHNDLAKALSVKI